MLAPVLRASTRVVRASLWRQTGALLAAGGNAPLREALRPAPGLWLQRDFASRTEGGEFASQSAPTWREKVEPALRTFLKLNKHSMIPGSFVVPHEDETWPRAAWGYPLGQHAAWLRRQYRKSNPLPAHAVRDLETLEFAWDFPQYKWDRRIKPSLRIYSKVFGDCLVPQNFTVPSESPWPETAWGLKLGNIVHNMRVRGDYKKQSADDEKFFKDVGFVWDYVDAQWSEYVLPSLKVYREVFGDCQVSSSFVVPSESPWPERAWGRKLGLVVKNMRARDDYVKQVARDRIILEELGFVSGHFDEK